MSEKRFTSWGNRIKRNGKLLNIEFKTKTDAKLGCKLCNQMDKQQQEIINELDDVCKWYKDYYGETILDTRMGWNDDNKISKLEKENEELKELLELISRAHSFTKEESVKEILRHEIKAIDTVSGDSAMAWHDYCLLSKFFRKQYGEHWDNE